MYMRKTTCTVSNMIASYVLSESGGPTAKDGARAHPSSLCRRALATRPKNASMLAEGQNWIPADPLDGRYFGSGNR